MPSGSAEGIWKKKITQSLRILIFPTTVLQKDILLWNCHGGILLENSYSWQIIRVYFILHFIVRINENHLINSFPLRSSSPCVLCEGMTKGSWVWIFTLLPGRLKGWNLIFASIGFRQALMYLPQTLLGWTRKKKIVGNHFVGKMNEYEHLAPCLALRAAEMKTSSLA